jgi:hypothetical protein
VENIIEIPISNKSEKNEVNDQKSSVNENDISEVQLLKNECKRKEKMIIYKYLYKYEEEPCYKEKENKNCDYLPVLYKSMIKLFFVVLQQKQSKIQKNFVFNQLLPLQVISKNNNNDDKFGEHRKIFIGRYVRRAKERYVQSDCDNDFNIKKVYKQGLEKWNSLNDGFKKKFGTIVTDCASGESF